jgi:integrase
MECRRREQEVCRLRWDWEVKVPELETSVFVIPGERVKNGEERLVVLNRAAKSVIERMRGLHPVHVFVHARTKGGEARPVTKINNTAWKAARERAADEWQQRHGERAPEGFRRVRVHDLKHAFGRRLRAAGERPRSSSMTSTLANTWRRATSQATRADVPLTAFRNESAARSIKLAKE